MVPATLHMFHGGTLWVPRTMYRVQALYGCITLLDFILVQFCDQNSLVHICVCLHMCGILITFCLHNMCSYIHINPWYMIIMDIFKWNLYGWFCHMSHWCVHVTSLFSHVHLPVSLRVMYAPAWVYIHQIFDFLLLSSTITYVCICGGFIHSPRGIFGALLCTQNEMTVGPKQKWLLVQNKNDCMLAQNKNDC